MSKRIAKVYDGFLSYEKLKSTNDKPKKELSPSVGLGGRSRPANAPKAEGKFSELDRVAELIQAVREYRNV